jgi:hypothetical protein
MSSWETGGPSPHAAAAAKLVITQQQPATY